jgi:hypothetical protein
MKTAEDGADWVTAREHGNEESFTSIKAVNLLLLAQGM